MSLYLKYRPRSFAEVVGQDHIVTTLEHAVERDQLVHAYLLFGSRGTGKTSIARILAKILLIRGVEDEALQKQIIKSADEGSLVDLIEIDAATNRQIDDVRDLKEKVQFSPSVASAKVYIIDEVHMMTKEAFNALLKTLEEPPEHAYFILATTELHKVPDTIQSRCQRFPFRRVSEEDIVRCLQNIADKEHITVEREALRAIARHVNGGMRDAISLLDQLSSLEKIMEADVKSRIGESGEEYVERVWNAVDALDREELLSITSSLQEAGVSLEVFLRQLLASARQQLHWRIEAKESTAPALDRITAIMQALKDIRVSPVPIVALETALVGLCMNDDDLSKKKAPTKDKKAAVKEAKGKLEAKAEEGKGAEEPQEATVVADELTLESLQSVWSDLLKNVQPASLRMSLKDAAIHEVTDKAVTLAFSSSFHKDKVTDPSASRIVSEAIHSLFHVTIALKCTLGEESSTTSAKKKGDEVNIAEAVGEIFG